MVNGYDDENLTDNIDLDVDMENYSNIYITIKNFFIVSGVFICSACISFILVGFAMSDKIKNEYNKQFTHDCDSDCDSDDDGDSETEYENKYLDEYEKLELKELDTKTLDSFKSIYIENETPRGIIKMTYDNINDSFNYFSDNKDIPYSYLETLGRLFVIKNNCKSIFINHKKAIDQNILRETEKGGETEKGESEKGESEKGESEKSESKNSNVFVTFKTYNESEKGLDKKSNEDSNIELKFNRYIYKGKLRDYEDLIKDLNVRKQISDEFEHVDYTTFKKLSIEKKTV